MAELLTTDVFEDIKQNFIKHMNEGLKALVVAKDIYLPNPAAVVTFTEAYDRFATGYIENPLNGKKIPYTINYASLLSDSDLLEQSQWENGDPLYK